MKKAILTVIFALIAGVSFAANDFHHYTEANHDCHVWVESWDGLSNPAGTDNVVVNAMGGGIIFNPPTGGRAFEAFVDFRFDVSTPVCSNVTFNLGVYFSSNVPSIDGYWIPDTYVADPNVDGNGDGCFTNGELVDLYTSMGLSATYQITGIDMTYDVSGVSGDFVVNEVVVFDNADPSHCEF